jgi:hypothetical protein
LEINKAWRRGSLLREVDINRFVTGTLDSICEDTAEFGAVMALDGIAASSA